MKKTPAYIRVYQNISNQIIHGIYPYQSRIPSKREMAQKENCSLITIEHAYELLVDEGYIESRPRSGYYVSYQVGDVFESEVTPVDISVSFENTDITFPASVFAKACRKVTGMMHSKLPSRSEGKGNIYLRNAISKYLARSRNLIVPPEQIIIGAGSEYLYSLIVDLLGRSKIYGIESPSYEKIYRIYRASGVKVDLLKLGRNGILSTELERTPASILHVTPYHSFPTGSTTDASKRREYIQWANERHAIIVEDDYESEFTKSIKSQETLFSLDPQHVIYMNTFTKTLSSTVRISYMVLPASLTELFYKKLSFYSCTVSNFEQYTLARFMESGSFEKHINRLRNYYQNKRDAILEIFKTAPLDQYITIKEEDSGVHFMMKLKTDRTEMDMISDAKSKGIKLAPLSKYFVDQTSNMNFQNVYVMNYSSIDLEQLPLIFDALCQVLIK